MELLENVDEKKFKKCCKCKIEKDVGEFSRNNSHKDKLSSKCKECRRKEYFENIEENRNKKRKRYREKREEYLRENPIKEVIVDGMKECSKCKIKKNIDEFGKDKRLKSGLKSFCKECRKKYIEKNRDKIRVCSKKTYLKYREKILNENKIWREANKEYRKEYGKEYYENNKEKIKKQGKEYREEHKDYFSEKNKQWREENYEKRKKYKNEWNNKKRKGDICFKLRDNISSSIRKILKKNNSSKREYSVLKFLPFTIQQLKVHLESQFEPWMSWNNHGVYMVGGERKWHIDHIIPHSNFYYETMDCEVFQKCWALENLRPLEAVENMKKGNKIV